MSTWSLHVLFMQKLWFFFWIENHRHIEFYIIKVVFNRAGLEMTIIASPFFIWIKAWACVFCGGFYIMVCSSWFKFFSRTIMNEWLASLTLSGLYSVVSGGRERIHCDHELTSMYMACIYTNIQVLLFFWNRKRESKSCFLCTFV